MYRFYFSTSISILISSNSVISSFSPTRYCTETLFSFFCSFRLDFLPFFRPSLFPLFSPSSLYLVCFPSPFCKHYLSSLQYTLQIKFKLSWLRSFVSFRENIDAIGILGYRVRSAHLPNYLSKLIPQLASPKVPVSWITNFLRHYFINDNAKIRHRYRPHYYRRQ